MGTKTTIKDKKEHRKTTYFADFLHINKLKKIREERFL
jgi:hypothetical protein